MERMRTSPKNSLTREEGRARSFDNGEDRQPEFGTSVGNQFEIFDVVRNGAGLSAFGQPRRITALFQHPVDPFDRNADLHRHRLPIEGITDLCCGLRTDNLRVPSRLGAKGVVPGPGGFHAEMQPDAVVGKSYSPAEGP